MVQWIDGMTQLPKQGEQLTEQLQARVPDTPPMRSMHACRGPPLIEGGLPKSAAREARLVVSLLVFFVDSCN